MSGRPPRKSAANPNLVKAALGYARRGWPVLPLHNWTGTSCTCRDTSCDREAKHPRTDHGLKEATVDLAQIRRWWARWPSANVGLLTGVAFDALDVDGDHGLASLEAAVSDGLTVDGPTVLTGRPNGRHVYVAPTGLGSRVGFRPGLDWRGSGGYVVAPPSLHPSGATYRWELPEDPDFGPRAQIRPAPRWLLELLRPRPTEPKNAKAISGFGSSNAYGRRALESELGRLAVAPEGQRNSSLHIAAVRLGQLVATGQISVAEVVDALVSVGLRIGLPEREVERTVTSGMQFGLGHPR